MIDPQPAQFWIRPEMDEVLTILSIPDCTAATAGQLEAPMRYGLTVSLYTPIVIYTPVEAPLCQP